MHDYITKPNSKWLKIISRNFEHATHMFEIADLGTTLLLVRKRVIYIIVHT